jgi:hypothetical protein
MIDGRDGVDFEDASEAASSVGRAIDVATAAKS